MSRNFIKITFGKLCTIAHGNSVGALYYIYSKIRFLIKIKNVKKNIKNVFLIYKLIVFKKSKSRQFNNKCVNLNLNLV